MSPLIPAPAADPWMIYHGGFYYFCESRHQTTIHVRKSKSILEIGSDEGVKVWTPPPRGPASRNVWAPELHFLEGKWFIYYAADDGQNENHRMWVLESESADPQGNYHCRGQLETEGWAIDGTVLESGGARYFIWSGWPGQSDGRQNLYIALMASPWRLAGARRLLTAPEEKWERKTMPVCEAPEVLERNGGMFLVYSASASWTVDYCLGLLVCQGRNLLEAASWKKIGPVFKKSEAIWGVGHCSFVQSPCGGEDWILYHAKSRQGNGWLDRQVHAQRFSWRPDGLPDFGVPAPVGRPVCSLGEVRAARRDSMWPRPADFPVQCPRILSSSSWRNG